jgi:plastocyanin
MKAAFLGAVALVALLAATPATSKPGTVVHINDDDDAHTATADDGSWDSEGLNQGEKWTHTYAKAGTIKYHCTVHPMMHGIVVVKAGS